MRGEAEALTRGFINSTEYALRNRSHEDFVGDVYNGLLRRGGDPSGVAYWRGMLYTGAATRDEVLTGIIQLTPEFGVQVNAVIAAGCQP